MLPNGTLATWCLMSARPKKDNLTAQSGLTIARQRVIISLLQQKPSYLICIVQVEVVDARHVAIHAVLHRHCRCVLCIPERAHSSQVHPSLHMCHSLLISYSATDRWVARPVEIAS